MPKNKQSPFQAVVIGVSAGGLDALSTLLPALPATFGLPVIVCQHVREDAEGYLIEHLGAKCRIRVAEAEEKQGIEPGCVYIAPPGYHLLVELDKTFSLSVDLRVNYARPSVDVLFESAADAYLGKLVGVILTGANSDGSKGLRKIKECGGLTIVQDPESAYANAMPRAAIQETQPDHILPLEKIGPFLAGL